MLIADLPQSYPSSRAEATLVMTDTWPLAPSQGFLNSPILKYLGGDSVSGKAVHVWHFFSKNLFLKTICRIWTLWFKIKNRDTNRVRTVAGSLAGASTVSGDSAGDLESLTRTRDILFCFHLCVSLHCMCIGAPRNTVFAICHS